MIESRDYFPSVEEFLREIQDLHVTGLAMVALVDDSDCHDVVGVFDCGPFELASCAGILQLHASMRYADIKRTDDDEEGDVDNAED